MAVKIVAIKPDGLAAQTTIQPEDLLLSINGHAIRDLLDYQFYMTEPELELALKRAHTGDVYTCRLTKKQYDDIGLLFENYLMDQQQTCQNDCIFCFVNQMPPGMRASLYVKDDDARMSFLFGNYITLTNLKQSDIDRLIAMRVSPINVSVHTTNLALRCEMMKNRFAGQKLDFLRQLAEAGLTINVQIVLCPTINDGEELNRTLLDLYTLYPAVQSVACVPVGLTKYRDGLPQLKSYDLASATATVEQIEAFASRCYEQNGTHFVYAADEFYLRAKRPLRDEAYYEDFAQLENGVGLLTLFLADLGNACREVKTDTKKRNIAIATGVDAAPFLTQAATKMMGKFTGTQIEVYGIRNDFFGETITVAGLVTGLDLLHQLKGRLTCELLLLPDCMFKHGEDCFLDDMTVGELAKALRVEIKICDTSAEALVQAVQSISLLP